MTRRSCVDRCCSPPPPPVPRSGCSTRTPRSSIPTPTYRACRPRRTRTGNRAAPPRIAAITVAALCQGRRRAGGTRRRPAITPPRRGYAHMAEHRHTEPDHADRSTTHADPVGLLYISDVQALRAADAVAFHTTSDGVAYIDACLSSAGFGEPRIYTARQQRLFPDADRHDRRRRIEVAADIAGFGTQRRWHQHHLPGATAFTLVDTAQLDEVWRSVAAFLRVGDVIRLHWRADNRADALHAMFLLDVQIRSDPVRMVTAPSGGPRPDGRHHRGSDPAAPS